MSVKTHGFCIFREKFIALQHENKMLRVQQEEYEREKIAALQTQLEEAHKSQSELDTENRFNQLIDVMQDVYKVICHSAGNLL